MSSNDRKYTNGEITVYWRPAKCIHATTCFRELIEVFNPRKRPWVNMQGAPTNKIIEIVDKCPTQALAWKYNKDLSPEELSKGPEQGVELTPDDLLESAQKSSTTITIMKNGPILVEGEFRILGPDDKELRSTIMTSFCRCGNSRAQPYCDGTHRKVGFQG